MARPPASVFGRTSQKSRLASRAPHGKPRLSNSNGSRFASHVLQESPQRGGLDTESPIALQGGSGGLRRAGGQSQGQRCRGFRWGGGAAGRCPVALGSGSRLRCWSLRWPWGTSLSQPPADGPQILLQGDAGVLGMEVGHGEHGETVQRRDLGGRVGFIRPRHLRRHQGDCGAPTNRIPKRSKTTPKVATGRQSCTRASSSIGTFESGRGNPDRKGPPDQGGAPSRRGTQLPPAGGRGGFRESITNGP